MVSNTDGSADWVVIIWIVVLILAVTGGLSCFGGPTNVPPGDRPCVEQMTNAAC